MFVLFVLLILTRSLNVLLHISYPFYHDIQCFQIELIASMVLFRQIERLNFYFTLLFLYLITQLPHIFSKLVKYLSFLITRFWQDHHLCYVSSGYA